MKKEFKSAKDALIDFSPWQWKKQMDYVKQLTPEEYETVLLCKAELKANCKVYAFYMSSLAIAFSYW
jgi:hypothetical protein